MMIESLLKIILDLYLNEIINTAKAKIKNNDKKGIYPKLKEVLNLHII